MTLRTLGPLGGRSWESAISYCRRVNEYACERLGRLHSARQLLHSLGCAEIETLQHRGQRRQAATIRAEHVADWSLAVSGFAQPQRRSIENTEGDARGQH